MLFVALLTGLRQGEMIGLTWDCIDFRKGQITVYRQPRKERRLGGGGAYTFTPLKNDRVRVLTPAPEVLDTLRWVQCRQKENRLKAGNAWSNPLNLVFTSALGGHLNNNTVYENFKRIAAKIGIPATRFHDLRHTYATMLFEKGIDVPIISHLLGYSSTAVTYSTYIHFTNRIMQNTVTALNKID